MSSSDLIRAAHTALTMLVAHTDDLDTVVAEHKSAATQLHATALELSQASKRLAAVKVELKKAEGDLEAKRHIIHDEAARALQDLNRQIATRQEDLRKLEAQVKETKGEYDNILAGMAALHQRLRV